MENKKIDSAFLKHLIESEHRPIDSVPKEEIEKLTLFLKANGYFQIRAIQGYGLCGLNHTTTGVGLFVGLTKEGHMGYYNYPEPKEAFTAMLTWNGGGDPPGAFRSWTGCKRYYAAQCQVCIKRIIYVKKQSLANSKESPFITLEDCNREMCPFNEP